MKTSLYPFSQIEPQWQNYWEENKSFKTPGFDDANFDPKKPKYYALDMFPYPSGAGLHVGHPEGYTATDIVSRSKRMQNFQVLHPIGWDAFGLPAEQYAIKTGQHPRVTTEANINNFRRQLKSLGFSYDWEREIDTTDPSYVKWTQSIFLKLYNSYFNKETQKAQPVSELIEQGWTQEQIDDVRLAYISNVSVNWSPDLGTVLANEEVEEWTSKGHTVEKRPLRQWMLRITAYADRLINELENLDWPESIKQHQKNWIGKSYGAQVEFPVAIDDCDEVISVFTTRPDTLFGVTYLVVAPEHPLLDIITTSEQQESVANYKAQCQAKTDVERQVEDKTKTGVFTGAYASHPITQELIPIWSADYVMMGYGTGCVMAVPAHDPRDFDFAKAFELAIKQVVTTKAEFEANEYKELNQAYSESGININSDFLNGLKTKDAKQAIFKWLIDNEKGSKKVQYKLRDWLFSRQRYWGEPFPIVWKDGQHSAIDESELPLTQPEMEDFKPTGDPRGPLVKATEWLTHPSGAMRETNTMPQWAGSCWYYLRYCDPSNNQRFISKEAEDYWMKGNGNNVGGVDLYVGGTEHAVLHLLYARFWHKVLYDLGEVSTIEPFQKLVNQGLIMGADGRKMSKSLGNVINPDDITAEYGADSLRLYEMFMGPLEQVKPWNTKGVEGVHRFLGRIWNTVIETTDEGANWQLKSSITTETNNDSELFKTLQKTIDKVTEDISKLSFNTAISQLMELSHLLKDASDKQQLPLDMLADTLKLLSPFAPHISEEIWDKLADKFDCITGICSEQNWPIAQEVIETQVTLAIQINGKRRGEIVVPIEAQQADIEKLVIAEPSLQHHLEDKQIRKIIFVPKRLINIVVG